MTRSNRSPSPLMESTSTRSIDVVQLYGQINRTGPTKSTMGRVASRLPDLGLVFRGTPPSRVTGSLFLKRRSPAILGFVSIQTWICVFVPSQGNSATCTAGKETSALNPQWPTLERTSSSVAAAEQRHNRAFGE